MLIAALLIARGHGRRLELPATAADGEFDARQLGWLALWAFVWTTLDIEKILLLFADLAAHQAGYLVGRLLERRDRRGSLSAGPRAPFRPAAHL